MYDLHARDPRYPKSWNKIRFYVFKRDNYTCRICGRRTMRPHCHHIIPISKANSSSHPNNLVTLCSRCHKRIHNKL